MTTEPVPRTARQREILRRLRLVGGAPESYFADACTLMANEPPLASQTHLVSHLMRELNGGLIGALEPMVAPEDWPEKGAEGRQAQMISAICDALRVPADDPLRESWQAFSEGLAKLAHRQGLISPRPVDPGFEEHWELGETVVHAVTQRIEANYAENLPRIEQLARGKPDIKAFQNAMLHSTVALDRFYGLAGVDWLVPLREDGVFRAPPPLVANEEGMYAYPRWPPGRFLARVASEVPKDVIEIGLDLDTDNPEAHESFVEAAMSMQISDAVVLAPRIAKWLAGSVHWGLPAKARDLIVRFVAEGAVDEGLSMVWPLVTTEGEHGLVSVDGEEVAWLVERVFPVVGIVGFELLIDLLVQQANAEGGRGLSYTQIWRPDIRSERMRDDRDHLVSGVRDAAASLAGAGTDIGDVVATLERAQLEITRRIATDLLSQYASSDVAQAHLLDRDLLEGGAYRKEYVRLAQAGFAQLSAASQAQLLEWIDEARPHAAHPERQRLWQLVMLTALGDQLSEAWTSRRAELEKEFGPVDLEETAGSPFRMVGSRSPLSAEEIRGMGVDGLVDFLQAWKPEDGFDSPSPDGLATVIVEVIKEEPSSFAGAAPIFAGVDPTYVRALLSGLEGALEAGHEFAWAPVLDLIAVIGERPGEPAQEDQLPTDLDPGWSWSWQQGLELILDGLRTDSGIGIDPDLFGVAFEIAKNFAARPDVSLADKEEDGREPESLALGSFRCTAIRVLIALAARNREADPTGKEGLDAATASLLEQFLNPEAEPSRAVRSVFGWSFGRLLYCDEGWAVARVPEIFPVDDEPLWRAAWESFVMRQNPHEKLLDVLGAHYYRAIDEIRPEKPEERLNDPDEHLVGHLASYYLWGLVDFDAGTLLARFYEKASVERRAEVVSILGTSMETLIPLSEEVEARLRALVEHRLRALESGSGADELAGFAWWFSSGGFDTEWSLDFLRRALEAGCRPHPDHVVVDRLTQLAGVNVVGRIEILRLMVEGGARDWFVLGSRERIEAILREGLASGGEGLSKARDLVNVLVARGNLEFADLL